MLTPTSQFSDKQKNRKPGPAVKEQFRKFPFYLFNC
ncbi:putative prophage protein, partial [Streptococcus pneumoniae]